MILGTADSTFWLGFGFSMVVGFSSFGGFKIFLINDTRSFPILRYFSLNLSNCEAFLSNFFISVEAF